MSPQCVTSGCPTLKWVRWKMLQVLFLFFNIRVGIRVRGLHLVFFLRANWTTHQQLIMWKTMYHATHQNPITKPVFYPGLANLEWHLALQQLHVARCGHIAVYSTNKRWLSLVSGSLALVDWYIFIYLLHFSLIFLLSYTEWFTTCYLSIWKREFWN